MLSASALTEFLSSVCSDGVDHAIVVNSEGSLLGVGTAENVTTNVSKKKKKPFQTFNNLFLTIRIHTNHLFIDIT